jgi:hypothetical protein
MVSAMKSMIGTSATRAADDGTRVHSRGVVPALRRRDHRGLLGVARGAHHRRALRCDVPFAAGLFHQKMRERHARRPLPRLREQHAVDRRIRDLAVRVAEHDQIDAGHVARHTANRILVERIARDPGVRDEHDRVRAGRPRVGHRFGNGRRDRADGHAGGAKVRRIPAHGAGRRRADDADVHAIAADHRPRTPGARRASTGRVGGEQLERRRRHFAMQRGNAVIELMIADGHRVVVHGVHRGDHGAWLQRVDARGGKGERIPLQKITGIDQHHAIRIRGADGIDDRRRAGESAGGFRGVGVVVPAADATVHVGGRRDDNIDRLPGGWGGRQEQKGGGVESTFHGTNLRWSTDFRTEHRPTENG